MEKNDIEITLARLLDANQVRHQLPDASMRSRLSSSRKNPPMDHGIRRLGYVLGKEIGRGALGRVNLATQQVFDRAVAVKRLLNDGADHDASLKFYAEAIVTSQLEHPNIVPIHDLLANADGALQLVMKRVEGISWKDLLRPRTSEQKHRAEALSLDDHVDILLKVCDAVAFAHGRGILHRDIKPENVMVGEFGEVLLMDWGCAVAFGETEHHPIVPRVEEITEVTGTPSYMAPEMALIRTASIGPHSDVYQLGAVLYELLTGMHPNRGKTVLEVLTSAVQGPLSDPQLLSPERFIPEELATIALSALVKDPKRRLASVAQFIERLRNYRRHVQAIVLVGTARGQLSLASSNPKLADDALRKATSWAEQALEIWPNWSGAKSVLLDARLASANHSYLHGSYTLSVQQAQAAAHLAHELQRTELEDNALSLSGKATEAIASRATRQQRLRLLRIGMGCLLALTVIGLAWYLEVLDSREQKLHAELQQAREAVTSLKQGQGSGQRSEIGTDMQSGALIDVTLQSISNGQWSDASSALDHIMAADPRPLQARALRTGVLIAQHQYAAALKSCGEWLQLVPNDASVQHLRQSLQKLSDGTDLDPEVSQEFSRIFSEAQCPALATVFATSPDQRLSIYRNRLNASWPGFGDFLTLDENGRISASGKSWVAAIAKHRELSDLSPLHGIPLVELDLSGTAISSIEPLVGMPLEVLNINNTAINNISALKGTPLYELDMEGTLVSDVTPLSGLKLRILKARHSRLSDLGPLHGMSFLTLDCSDTKISNLTFLEKSNQRFLTFENCPITDLTPLEGDIISELDLDGCPVQDATVVAQLQIGTFIGVTNASAQSLRTISRMQGSRLNLGTAPNLNDLSPLAQMQLISLTFHSSRVSSLAPLQAMPLEILICDHSPISDLSPLLGKKLSRLDISSCPLRNISALPSLPLTSLHASDTPMNNQMLGLLAHMPISELWIDHTQVRELSALARMPLEDIRIGPFVDWHRANIDALRHIPTLRFIGVSSRQFMEVGEFWAELDAGTLPMTYRQ